MNSAEVEPPCLTYKRPFDPADKLSENAYHVIQKLITKTQIEQPQKERSENTLARVLKNFYSLMKHSYPLWNVWKMKNQNGYFIGNHVYH